MTIPKYLRKVTVASFPERLTSANILIRYAPDYAAKGKSGEQASDLEDLMRHLRVLIGRRFLGLSDLRHEITPYADGLGLMVTADDIPLDLVVILSRLIVGLHDTDPASFQTVLYALDFDEDEARKVWAGVMFETAITAVEVTSTGIGPDRAFDIFWMGGAAGEVWEADALTFPGLAHATPGPDLEDAILSLSGMGAFWPLGLARAYVAGEEEYFARKGALVLSQVSVEAAALRAVLMACGASGDLVPTRD